MKKEVIFVAYDGTRFDSEEECVDYETNSKHSEQYKDGLNKLILNFNALGIQKLHELSVEVFEELQKEDDTDDYYESYYDSGCSY